MQKIINKYSTGAMNPTDLSKYIGGANEGVNRIMGAKGNCYVAGVRVEADEKQSLSNLSRFIEALAPMISYLPLPLSMSQVEAHNTDSYALFTYKEYVFNSITIVEGEEVPYGEELRSTVLLVCYPEYLKTRGDIVTWLLLEEEQTIPIPFMDVERQLSIELYSSLLDYHKWLVLTSITEANRKVEPEPVYDYLHDMSEIGGRGDGEV